MKTPFEDLGEAVVTLSDGMQAKLGDFWSHRPVVLVFLRHFG